MAILPNKQYTAAESAALRAAADPTFAARQANMQAQMQGGAAGQVAGQQAQAARDKAVAEALSSKVSQRFTFVDPANVAAQQALNTKYGLSPDTGFKGIAITPESVKQDKDVYGQTLPAAFKPNAQGQNVVGVDAAGQRGQWSVLTPPQVPVPTGNPKADEAAQQAYQSQLNAYAATIATRQKAAQSSAYNAEQKKAELRAMTEQGLNDYQYTQPAREDFATDEEYQKALDTYTQEEAGDFDVNKMNLRSDGLEKMPQIINDQEQPRFDYTALLGEGKFADFMANAENGYDSILKDMSRLGAAQLGLDNAQFGAFMKMMDEQAAIAKDEKAKTEAELKATKQHLIDVKTNEEQNALKSNELAKQRSEADYDEQLSIQRDNNSRLQGFLQGKFAAAGMLDSSAGLELLTKYMGSASLGIAKLERDKQDASAYYEGQKTKIMTDFANTAWEIEFNTQKALSDNTLNYRKEVNSINKDRLSSLAQKQQSQLNVMKEMANTRKDIQDKKTSLVQNLVQEKRAEAAFQHQITQDGLQQANWEKQFNQNKYEFNANYNLNRYDVKTGIDSFGNEYTYRIDKLTGEKLDTTNAGLNLYTGDSNVNPNPYAKDGVVGLSGAKIGEYGGQCGKFTRVITGFRVGDSYASKVEALEKNGRLAQPVTGSIFVMPTGGTSAPYGHIGVVASTGQDKKGKFIMALDSNWNNDEKTQLHKIYTSQIEKDGGGYTAPKSGSIAQLFNAGAQMAKGVFDFMKGDKYSAAGNVIAGATKALTGVAATKREQTKQEDQLSKFAQPVKDWATQIQAGNAKITNVPEKYQEAVNRYMALSPASAKQADISSLPAAAQTDYREYNQIYRQAGGLADEVEANKNTSTGIYAKFFNDKRKFLDLAQDPAYADIIQRAQLVQAPFRHKLLGANQTPTEVENATFFITADDKAADIVRKLKNIAQFGKQSLDLIGEAYDLAPLGGITQQYSTAPSNLDNYLQTYGY